MEYKNEKLSARFVVPDKITVRQQLAYLSEISSAASSNHIEKLWIGARPLITEWECPDLADIDTDLSKIDNPKVTDVIMWVAVEVKKHINNLESIPKN
jgi:hypothetical protein